MDVTIHIPRKIEQDLKIEAEREGISLDSYILSVVSSQLSQVDDDKIANMSEEELLFEINKGFAPKFWEKYYRLIEKKNSETLTPREHTKLVEMTDLIESLNSKRMRFLAILAEKRTMSLDDLMAELGLLNNSYV